LAWLGLGLLRLNAYRRGAERYLDTGDATIEISGAVGVPVTFGLLHPIVLLPPSILAMDEPARQAVIDHELLHVRRHDWLFAVIEEICFSLIWFVPAVWSLAAQIRLAREQAVDEAVIRNGAAPESYVQALVAIASQRSQRAFGAAPLLIDKSHLHTRVRSMVEEVRVSFPKAVLSYAAALGAVAFTGTVITKVAPLRAQPIATEQADVRVEGARLLDRAKVSYPISAWKSGAEGVVVCEANIGANGEVVDARVIAGPPELRRAALTALLGWRFDEGRKTAQVHITFRRPSLTNDPSGGKINFEISEKIPSNMQESLRLRLRDFDGLPFDNSLLGSIMESVRAVSQNLRPRVVQQMVGDESVTTFHIEPGATQFERLSNAQSQPIPTGPIRVGGAVQQANLIDMPAPEYPALAKQARIQGTVRFNVIIAKDGTVTNLSVVSGHPLLVPAATESARRARYRPALLNGQPVEVSTQETRTCKARPLTPSPRPRADRSTQTTRHAPGRRTS
jgi:TonB family protein